MISEKDIHKAMSILNNINARLHTKYSDFYSSGVDAITSDINIAGSFSVMVRELNFETVLNRIKRGNLEIINLIENTNDDIDKFLEELKTKDT